jgi:hypothetical protein
MASSDTLVPAAAEEDVEGLRTEVERLRSELTQAQLKLREAGGKLEEWQTLVEDALHTAVFSAEASERYRLHASLMIRSALTELPQVTRLKYVRCSFPCVRRESPRLRLAKYTSLSSSEWEVNFSPSWSVDVLVEVRPRRLLLARVPPQPHVKAAEMLRASSAFTCMRATTHSARLRSRGAL